MILGFTFLFQGVKVIYRTKELEEQQAKRLVDSIAIMGGKYLLDFEHKVNFFSLPPLLPLLS